MEKQRLPTVTKRMTDESDAKGFRFTFYCDRCGTGYQTKKIPFSITDAPGRLEDFTKAQKLIWNAEHEDAYERGNRTALITFDACEDCGQYICETCGGELEPDTACSDCRRLRASGQSPAQRNQKEIEGGKFER